MSETITREQLDEAIREFADKIMAALEATVTDEADLTGTEFKAVNIDGNVEVMCAESIAPGTLLTVGPFEYFRCSTGALDNTTSWVQYSGRSLTHEGFAEEMRNVDVFPRIIHEG